MKGHLMSKRAFGVSTAVLCASHVGRHMQRAVERLDPPVGRSTLVEQVDSVSVLRPRSASPLAHTAFRRLGVHVEVGSDGLYLAVRRCRLSHLQVRAEVCHEEHGVFDERAHRPLEEREREKERSIERD
eukprot:scaffold143264_cov31-Tisochrysis_lutea.AAC.2